MSDEFAWKDADECHGRVIGYDELRLEQPGCPEDAVAGLEAGDPPKDGTIWAAMVYLTANEAVEAGLALLDAAWRGWAETRPDGEGPVNRMSDEQRWRAHVAACSVTDMTFWVRKDGDHPGYYEATEVETGVSAWGVTEREAMDNYFRRKHERPPAPSARSADGPE